MTAPIPVNGKDTYDSTLTISEKRVAEAFFRSIPPSHPIRFYCSRGEYVVQLAVGNHRQEVRDASFIGALAQCSRIHDLLTIQADTTEAA